MSIAEDGRQAVAFNALAKNKRAARLPLPHHLAAHAQGFERGPHFGFDIARKLVGAVGFWLSLGIATRRARSDLKAPVSK